MPAISQYIPDVPFVDVEQALTLDSIFYYRGEKAILQGVYLRVEPGKLYGLLGVNGSGKSTLLKVAAGQLLPTSGAVTIDGEIFTTPRLKQRFAKIAYLPQETMLPKDLKVRDIILAFPKGSQILLKDHLLSLCLSSKVGSLSRGQRRYLELKLVLVLDREYVLLDEPFTGIDPLIIGQMLEAMVCSAESGKGIIVTDHYYRDVLSVVDTVYLMLNRQCKRIENRAGIKEQLQEIGYLG